jgi:hypothetical protein
MREPRALSLVFVVCIAYLFIVITKRETPSSFRHSLLPRSACKTARDSNRPMMNVLLSKKKKNTLDVIAVNEDFIVFYVFGEGIEEPLAGGGYKNPPQRDTSSKMFFLFYTIAPVKQINFGG